MSKVKVTAWKRRLIAKSLLSFRKWGSLKLIYWSRQDFDRKLQNSNSWWWRWWCWCPLKRMFCVSLTPIPYIDRTTDFCILYAYSVEHLSSTSFDNNMPLNKFWRLIFLDNDEHNPASLWRFCTVPSTKFSWLTLLRAYVRMRLTRANNIYNNNKATKKNYKLSTV